MRRRDQNKRENLSTRFLRSQLCDLIFLPRFLCSQLCDLSENSDASCTMLFFTGLLGSPTGLECIPKSNRCVSKRVYTLALTDNSLISSYSFDFNTFPASNRTSRRGTVQFTNRWRMGMHRGAVRKQWDKSNTFNDTCITRGGCRVVKEDHCVSYNGVSFDTMCIYLTKTDFGCGSCLLTR